LNGLKSRTDAVERRLEDAPNGQWLSINEAAGFCGYSTDEWEERVALGLIRPGSPNNLRGKVQWRWEWVQAVSWNRDWIDSEMVRVKREQKEERQEARKSKKRTPDDDDDEQNLEA